MALVSVQSTEKYCHVSRAYSKDFFNNTHMAMREREFITGSGGRDPSGVKGVEPLRFLCLKQ